MMTFRAVAALAVPFLCACTAADRAPPPSRLVEGSPMYDVLPRDGIPAIDQPEFISATEAAPFMVDDEPVIGVLGSDGTAKCYSAWHLDVHEIVNDTLDGKPIAVTW